MALTIRRVTSGVSGDLAETARALSAGGGVAGRGMALVMYCGQTVFPLNQGPSRIDLLGALMRIWPGQVVVRKPPLGCRCFGFREEEYGGETALSSLSIKVALVLLLLGR